MKQLILISSIALASVVGLSSCHFHDDDYYSPTPSTGYQHSFSDAFNTDYNQWSFKDNGNNASVYLSNGQLHYDYAPVDNGTNTVAVSTGMPASTYRFDIQTRIRSNNAMALVWGVSASDFGYSFFIDDRGYFAVYDEGTASIKSKALIDWTQSAAIRTGWNDVELESTANGSWIGYVNGTQVFEIPARTLYGSQVGYMVLANTAGDAEFIDMAW
jgi:hypothetical protein